MPIHPPASFRGVFRADDVARAVYSEAAGIGRAWPAAVAVPADAADVANLVRWARDVGQSLVPRGSGSSMAGGAIGDGVIVDLSRLRELEAPDTARRRIRAGAGALCGQIDRAAATAGLRFPVDPSSGEFCTIGGMVSSNAAGPRTMRFGATRPWVVALECVFDDGSTATLRRGEPPPRVEAIARFERDVRARIAGAPAGALAHAGVLKDSSGYGLAAYAASGELVDLLVGSEGTLAVITAVELALTAVPPASASLLLAFDDVERAVEAAVATRAAGAAACELLDRTFLAIARDGGHPLPVPPDSDAVLLVDIEGDDAGQVDAAAARLQTSVTALGATTTIRVPDRQGEAELWAMRHAASPALARLDPRFRSMQFVEDAAVPPAALAAYVRGVRRILADAGTAGVIFGHAGDAHVHVNALVDVSDPRWRSRVERILDDVTALVVRLGGTLAGEHGDGRIRAPLLDRVWSPEVLALFVAVKRAFDPRNVLNPGVKVALAGQPPIADVKYDPALRALPAAARRALDTVEHERAYSRLRLDLV